MSRKRELAKNTAILTVGRICSQLVSFFLLPLYTAILSKEDYGTFDLFITYGTLLLPIVNLQLDQGLFRFMLDYRGDDNELRKIFSSVSCFNVFQCFVFGLVILIVQSFIRIKHLKFPVTIILLAGKNEKVYNYFEKKKDKVPSNITLVPLKFTPLAYEYYGASDVFITKSGPNAVLDSLFMGTPVIVDYYAHNIEKASAKLFVDTLKCGVTCYFIRHLPKTVTYLYEHPSYLEALRANINKNVNKNQNGSEQIADIIISELKERNLLK